MYLDIQQTFIPVKIKKEELHTQKLKERNNLMDLEGHDKNLLSSISSFGTENLSESLFRNQEDNNS